jgi:hypothetical protein
MTFKNGLLLTKKETKNAFQQQIKKNRMTTLPEIGD